MQRTKNIHPVMLLAVALSAIALILSDMRLMGVAITLAIVSKDIITVS